MNRLSLRGVSPQVKQYLVITGNYWAFTLTDGALRMLVVLYFHQLGYSPLNIAMLFLFYEVFGVVTNLLGGWVGARFGLNKTMNVGLALQIVALVMLTVSTEMLTVVYVMVVQALSGIAKDLNKMSAKSAIKLLVTDDAESKLYQWISILTGSKNTLKGVGFFLGGVLLTILTFKGAIIVMATLLTLVWVLSLLLLKEDLGKSKNKPKFKEVFSKSESINRLSAARMFLFGARDVWFVVALPVYLAVTFDWNHWWVSGFMALWVIGYGIVQSFTPYITGKKQGKVPSGKSAFLWACILSLIPLIIASLLYFDVYIQASLLVGLLIFGVIFAINSSLHSYLIVSYANKNSVSLDVGFYYMANAMGRLIGTVLSGWVFQQYGLIGCLLVSTSFVVFSSIISFKLPDKVSV